MTSTTTTPSETPYADSFLLYGALFFPQMPSTIPLDELRTKTSFRLRRIALALRRFHKLTEPIPAEIEDIFVRRIFEELVPAVRMKGIAVLRGATDGWDTLDPFLRSLVKQYFPKAHDFSAQLKVDLRDVSYYAEWAVCKETVNGWWDDYREEGLLPVLDMDPGYLPDVTPRIIYENLMVVHENFKRSWKVRGDGGRQVRADMAALCNLNTAMMQNFIALAGTHVSPPKDSTCPVPCPTRAEDVFLIASGQLLRIHMALQRFASLPRPVPRQVVGLFMRRIYDELMPAIRMKGISVLSGYNNMDTFDPLLLPLVKLFFPGQGSTMDLTNMLLCHTTQWSEQAKAMASTSGPCWWDDYRTQGLRAIQDLHIGHVSNRIFRIVYQDHSDAYKRLMQIWKSLKEPGPDLVMLCGLHGAMMGLFTTFFSSPDWFVKPNPGLVSMTPEYGAASNPSHMH